MAKIPNFLKNKAPLVCHSLGPGYGYPSNIIFSRSNLAFRAKAIAMWGSVGAFGLLWAIPHSIFVVTQLGRYLVGLEYEDIPKNKDIYTFGGSAPGNRDAIEEDTM